MEGRLGRLVDKAHNFVNKRAGIDGTNREMIDSILAKGIKRGLSSRSRSQQPTLFKTNKS